MDATARASGASSPAERLARDKLARDRDKEESDLALRERVLRGEITLERYLTVHRGYSADMLLRTLRPH